MPRNPVPRLWAWTRGFAAGAALALGLVLPAFAVDVSNLNDSGAGSLRAAILVTPSGGTINFVAGALSGTITLTTGEIAFAKSLTLVGPGANNVTVSSAGSRIFNLTGGGNTFTVSGLTLTGNNPAGTGGAIASNGQLIVDSVQFSSSQASDGGGAIFVGPLAPGDLGAAIIRNSAFSGNLVSGASGAGGGAILVAGMAGSPTLLASLTLVNSTVSGNLANASIGMAGGGIAFANATVVLISTTIAFNHAGAAGANLDQGALANTTLTLKNSIVSNGIIDVSPITLTDRDIYQPGGATIVSDGFNVVQQRSAALGYQSTDAPNGTDPLLAPLANNGGPTFTHALLLGSPALDFVPDAQCTDDLGAPLLRDQRGPAFVRQVGGKPCDAGAFEAQAPDFVVAKSHVGNFTQGQMGATYTITARNIGVAAGSGTVSVVDTLPASMTATGLSGSGWVCTLATLTCTRGDSLAPGLAYPPITLTVNVAGNAPANVTNVATVSGGGELNTSNDTANDPTLIAPVADVTIAKTHSSPFTQGQIGATYTITVSNVGAGSTVGAVNVVDTLPAGLAATGLSGTGWACNLGTLTCTRSDPLAPAGSYAPITLTVNVASNAAPSVTNVATVSGGGEINVSNDTAKDITAILPVADVTITKTHGGNFFQGQVGATYTITVTNVGTGPTVGTVTVVDTVPGGLMATGLAGTGWACTLGTLTCMRGDVLGVGASYPPITLTVTVANNAAPIVTNTATVSGGGEINTANDSASDPTTIAGGPDLTLMKSHSGNLQPGATGVVYTLVVTNIGLTPTLGTVTVVDTLPPSLKATSISGTGWMCSLATLTCTRSDVLLPGASYPPITLLVNVAGNATGIITNTATASGGGDVNPGNGTGNDTVNLSVPLGAAGIPALSPWLLLLLVGMLLLGGAWALRRARA